MDIYNPRNAKPLLDTFTGKTDVDPNKPSVYNSTPEKTDNQDKTNEKNKNLSPLGEIFSARDAMAGEKSADPDHGLRP